MQGEALLFSGTGIRCPEIKSRGENGRNRYPITGPQDQKEEGEHISGLRSKQDIPAIQREQSTEQGKDPAAFYVPETDIDDITQNQCGQDQRHDSRRILSGAAGEKACR